MFFQREKRDKREGRTERIALVIIDQLLFSTLYDPKCIDRQKWDNIIGHRRNYCIKQYFV